MDFHKGIKIETCTLFLIKNSNFISALNIKAEQYANRADRRLTLSTLGKMFNRRHFEIFFSYFSQETGLDIACKLIPLEKGAISYLP